MTEWDFCICSTNCRGLKHNRSSSCTAMFVRSRLANYTVISVAVEYFKISKSLSNKSNIRSKLLFTIQTKHYIILCLLGIKTLPTVTIHFFGTYLYTVVDSYFSSVNKMMLRTIWTIKRYWTHAHYLLLM